MNKVVQLLQQHRSIRKFTDQPITESQLQAILKSAQAASTSSYEQAYSIVRVTDSETRSSIAELAGNQPYVVSAPEFLIFCADYHRNAHIAQQSFDSKVDQSWAESLLVATVDASLAAQNAVIAAESMDMGCCYIGGIRNDVDRVVELLSLPELVFPLFGLCLGYPAQDPETKPRLPVDVVLHQDKYRSIDLQRSLLAEYDTVVSQYYDARTKGKLTQSWSEQIAKKAQRQSRPHIKNSLLKQGLNKK